MAHTLVPRGPPPAPPHLPENPRSILIVRLTARGDVMFATPIIRALRRRYPDARLTWAVEPKAADVVLNHPGLDEVIVWNRPEWKRLIRTGRFRELWRAFRELRASLRAGQHDFAIDMQGLLRSGLVTWFSGAPIRIGLGSKEGSSILMTHRFPTGRVIEYLSGEPGLMAQWLGLDTSDWALDLHLTDEIRAGARRSLKAAGVEGPFVLLVPFTTRPWKHWIEPRWGPLAVSLKAATGLPVVMAGGPDDRAAAERILAAAGGDLVDLVGKTSLAEAIGVVSEAALVVGVDTALTHAAHAFVRPTICLFGPTGYSEPPTPVARMVRHWLECAPCKEASKPMVCGTAYTCMDLITEEEVMGHALELLETKG